MDKKITERLAAGEVLIADGSTGATLMAAGLPPATPPEVWNVENPKQILALHHAYLDAGSQLILTNTFGGTRLKLDAAGVGSRALDLNRAAAALAHEAGGERAYVGGDVGPTGLLMSPLGSMSFDAAVATFAEQIAVLAAGGVDLIWIETMFDLDEARAAVVAATQVTDLPIFCSLSFGRRGRTMMGLRADQAAEALWPLGLAAIGANCGEGFPPVVEALRQMHAALPDAPLIAKPNAGLPRLVEDRTVFDMTPADFAAHTPELVDLGARIVGGCCGSTAAHIAAVAAAIRERQT